MSWHDSWSSKEGWLRVRPNKLFALRHRRYCRLYADQARLIIFKTEKTKKPALDVNLRGACVETLPAEPSRPDRYHFVVRAPDQPELHLCAKADFEAESWMTALRAAAAPTATPRAEGQTGPVSRPSPPSTPSPCPSSASSSPSPSPDEDEHKDSPHLPSSWEWGGVVDPDVRSMVQQPMNDLLDAVANQRCWRLESLRNSSRVSRVQPSPSHSRCSPSLLSRAGQFLDSLMKPTPLTTVGAAERSALNRVRCSSVIQAPPALVFSLLMDVAENRAQWDVLFERGRVLEDLHVPPLPSPGSSFYDPRGSAPSPPASRSPEEQALRGTDVLYMEWRPLLDTSLIPPRDFCLLRSWHKFSRPRSGKPSPSAASPASPFSSDDEGPDTARSRLQSYAIVERSVEHRHCPPRPSHVRGSIESGGWVIEPIDSSMPGAGGSMTLLTYVADVRLGGWISRVVSPQMETSLIRSRLVSRVAGLREFVAQVLSVHRAPSAAALLPTTLRALPSMPLPSLNRRNRASSNPSGLDVTAEVKRLERRFRNESGEPELDGLVRDAQGGLRCVDVEQLKRQKGVLTHFLKKMGSNLLEGKSIINISLPVKIFEPRSFLQRMVDIWCYAPTYLARAAALPASEAEERLRLVVAFVVSGLHQGCVQLKCFNPILGETFQAEFPGGAKVYSEQVSHHPPISSFQIFGAREEWQFHGSHTYAASFSTNAIIGQQNGPNVIKFADGSKITFNMPHAYIGGMLWGERVMSWTGTVEFRDAANELGCDLRFNPDKQSGLSSMFSSPATPIDTVRGEIFRMVGEDERQSLAAVEGSWLTDLRIDGKSYWRIGDVRPMHCRPIDAGPELLPSDCRFREDLLALLTEDLDLAQDMKEKLENRQRADRKLRAKFAELAKKESKQRAKRGL